MKRKGVLSLLIGVILIMTLSACGGGGSGSSSGTANSTGGNGQVALMLGDGPSEDYDHIWITIQQAELLPANGGAPVVIFNPVEPMEYDLLNLRQENDQDGGALITLHDVPAGSYSKIRLDVVKVVGEKATVQTEFKLPSGKIDLNPQGPFVVESNITLAISIDIDCDKSIHVSGNNKNFRPVVFVDIVRAQHLLRCPRVLQGNVTALTYAEDQETVIGFTMTLAHSLIPIPILLDNSSVIIDDQGNVADAQELAVGAKVSVRGRLQEGGLLASMVVIGDMIHTEGIVTQAVVDSQFVISGDQVQTIELTPGTLILWGCNQELTPDAIQPGMPARVIGKMQDGRIVAVAVLLNPHINVSSLTAMEPVQGGYNLSVTYGAQGNGDTQTEPVSATIFLPTGAPIEIKGDGFLTPDQLMKLVACAPRIVEIIIGAPTVEPPIALKVVVIPELIEATVAQVNTEERTLVMDTGATIHVKAGVPIMDLTNGDKTGHHPAHHSPISTLEDIAVGDSIRAYAIALCPGAATDYEATTILIEPAE